MIVKKAEFYAAYGTDKQLPKPTKAEIVFVGRSNVGKSSLINKLCNRKNLARVSGEPGKTATINFYSVNDFFIADLPGYGYAKVSHSERRRWDRLINGYFEQDRNIALTVQLIDSRHRPSDDDMIMMDYLTQKNIPFIIALTKCDKLNKTEINNVIDVFKGYCEGFSYKDIIPTSVPKNIGIENLKDAIKHFLV